MCGFIALTGTMTGKSTAQPVPLQNATATYSQTAFGDQPVTQAIDGNFASGNGWSIYQGVTGDGGNLPGLTNPQVAVFETVFDTGTAGGTVLRFDLYHTYTFASPHTLGRFRISATTDARSEFADGLATGGDVTANWVVLDPQTLSATNGTLLSTLGDGSILASGPNPTTSVYSITTSTALDGITGFRLEVLADSSLADMGPGRASNGNFALTEFQVSVVPVPEPSTLAVVGLAAVGRFARRLRRR